MRIQRLLSSMSAIFLIIILNYPKIALANEMNLYDQPKEDAKVIGNIDSSKGIIPIYSPKKSEWIKVADPRNGNVGWIKITNINKTFKSGSTFSFSQSYSNNNVPIQYQVIKFSENEKTNSDESIIKQMQIQQESIHNMMQDMDRLFYSHWNFMNHFPLVMPIVMIPVEKITNDMSQKSSTKKESLSTK